MLKIGIVGCGPRGLAAIESFIAEAGYYKNENEFQLVVFEPEEHPGAGKVWTLKQSDANWINISLRGLSELSGRPSVINNGIHYPSFPKFTTWLEDQHGIITSNTQDKFPLRSVMGEYLSLRFESIANVLVSNNQLSIIRSKVEDVCISQDSVMITTDEGTKYNVSECLLSVGHQKTILDKQMDAWTRTKTNSEVSLFTHPYEKEIIHKVKSESVVSIRGLGLSTIDVIRKLTVELGGKFSRNDDSNLYFERSPKCPKKIIPFSLNGLICAPKPLNKQVDRIFEPSKMEITSFENEIMKLLINPNSIKSHIFIVETFSDCFATKFHNFFGLDDEKLSSIAKKWLLDSKTVHENILDITLTQLEYMRNLTEMALGRIKPSIDYAIGQYWRWLQPTMYRLFSHSGLSDTIMKKITKLDESTKRYSYGPPVESLLQMIALCEEGILDLSFANDPEINIGENGWMLQKNNQSALCDIMIDSVLSSPEVKKIKSGPIKSLLENHEIGLVSSDLGLSTKMDGQIEAKDGCTNRISVIGRNAKGSVLGVDAILECFGERVNDWATGVCKRIFT